MDAHVTSELADLAKFFHSGTKRRSRRVKISASAHGERIGQFTEESMVHIKKKIAPFSFRFIHMSNICTGHDFVAPPAPKAVASSDISILRYLKLRAMLIRPLTEYAGKSSAPSLLLSKF